MHYIYRERLNPHPSNNLNPLHPLTTSQPLSPSAPQPQSTPEASHNQHKCHGPQNAMCNKDTSLLPSIPFRTRSGEKRSFCGNRRGGMVVLESVGRQN